MSLHIHQVLLVWCPLVMLSLNSWQDGWVGEGVGAFICNGKGVVDYNVMKKTNLAYQRCHCISLNTDQASLRSMGEEITNQIFRGY